MKNKKILLLLAITIFIAKFSTAQLYINSSGGVSLGSVLSTYSGVSLQSFGWSLFSTTTGSTNSAACIVPANGYSSATTPDYTWWYDAQTGIYHPAANTIGITTGGTNRLTITNGVFNFDGGYQQNSSEVNIMTQNQPGLFVDAIQTTSYQQSILSIVNYAAGESYVMHYNGTDNFWVYGNGGVEAFAYYTTSDRTLKENIKPIDNALDKVLHLNGVTFNYIKQPKKDSNAVITDGPNPQQMGLIAQDVEKVVPEVINTDDKGIKSIAYSNLVGLLIEAIKEQDKKIGDLQTIVNTCCSSIQSGQTQNNNITATTNQSTSNSQALLYQNVPNPFTQTTTIKCYIPDGVSNASILIFDMAG